MDKKAESGNALPANKDLKRFKSGISVPESAPVLVQKK